MALILSNELRRAVSEVGEGELIEIFDPETNLTYVLLRADVFARLAAQTEPLATADSDEEQSLLLRGNWE